VSLIVLSWVIVVSIVACDETETPTGPGGCREVALNRNLYPIFHWGYASPDNFTDFSPNTEPQASDVGSPQWISSDSILVVSITRHMGTFLAGVFSVHIDPDTLTFEGVSEYEHAEGIYSIRWDGATASLLVLDSPAPLKSRVVRCHFNPNGLIVDEELVDWSWEPRHVETWMGHEGIVFSGVDPVSGIGGVYWRRPGGAVDSLLYAPAGPESLSGRFSFTADGTHLLVCVDLRDSWTAQLVAVSTTTPGVQNVVLARRHYSLGVYANPVDSDLAAFVYGFFGDDTHPPEDAVEVVRLSTGESEKLNVRTHAPTCHFTRVESVSWDPTGQDLAFTSGAISPEGDRYRSRLWILRPTSIP